MDTLIQELNRRYKIAISHMGTEFLSSIADYVELLLLNSDSKEILNKQEQEKDLPGSDNIWKYYNLLYENIYDPIKVKRVNIQKHFSNFTWLEDNDMKASDFALMSLVIWPPSNIALRQRKKYFQALELLHGQMVIQLKNKQLSPPQGIASTKYQFSELINALEIKPQTRWEDITIKFKKPGTNLEIIYGDKSYSATHEQLGFVSELNGTKPKLYWTFLRVMALNDETGTFPLHKFTGKEREKHNKTKQFLASHLKKIFGIDSEALEYDKDKQIYKIKIKLIPEKDFQTDWRDKNIYTEQDNFQPEYITENDNQD